MKLGRLLAAVLTAIALFGVATWLPLAHGSSFASGRPSAPRAERPAWPLWAHGQQAQVAATTESTPPQGALSAPRHGERLSFGEDATLRTVTDSATRPSLHEQPLWLGVRPLNGITSSTPTPPPRFA